MKLTSGGKVVALGVPLDVRRVRSESPKTISDQKLVGTHTLGKDNFVERQRSPAIDRKSLRLLRFNTVSRQQWTHGTRRLSGLQILSIS